MKPQFIAALVALTFAGPWTHPAAAESVAAAVIAPGWMATGNGILPAAGVPVDGFITLGVAFEEAHCGVTPDRLEMLDAMVTLAGVAVSGELVELPELDGELIWRPTAALEANGTYNIVLSGTVLPNHCVKWQQETIITSSFQTGAGVAIAAALPELAIEARQFGGAECAEATTRFDITSKVSPYVSLSVTGDGSQDYTVTKRYGWWSVSRPTPAQGHCATLVSTHLLTGKTHEQQQCTDDEGVLKLGCIVLDEGCATSGSGPALPLGMALLCLGILGLNRRREAR